MDQLGFLTEDVVREIRRQFGTPVYVYDEATLEAQAQKVLSFPHAYGLTARFAMKACPTAAIVRLFNAMGLHIDASSGLEAERAMAAGVPADHIQITAQEIPKNLGALLDKGVLYNACSLHQLREYGHLRPGTEISVRINPGLGSGHNNRTNVGGPASSFGIWKDYIAEVFEVLCDCNLRLTRMHTHIGSGGDPIVWSRCAEMSLDIASQLPHVTSLSLGGGFKVARVAGEKTADLQVIGERIRADFEDFNMRNGRKLHLEIEPGTFLVANAGAVVCTVTDVVDTGRRGYRFIKVDSGMTEVTRPTLYGAQHPLVVVPAESESRKTTTYIVAGHCCESGDILTPEPGNPEGLVPREMLEAQIGDAFVIGGAGAYCAGMSTKNYNSYPEAPEVMLMKTGELKLIRRRQTVEQMTVNELP